MMKRQILFLSCLLLLSPALLAASDGSLGNVAGGLMEPVSVVADFINSASLLIGASFIFAGVIKYMQYRVNPLAYPISTVVFLFIGGVLLLCLPLTYKLMGDEAPYKVQAIQSNQEEQTQGK